MDNDEEMMNQNNDDNPMDTENKDEMIEDDSDEDDNDDDDDDDNDETFEEQSEDENAKKKIFLPGKQNLKKDEELVVDLSAYRMLHRAQTGAPCLSFDVIIDNLGWSRETYPLSMCLVAGTHAAHTHVNQLIVMKMTNMTGVVNDDEESEESNDEDDEAVQQGPNMRAISIKHQGCVNRVRSTQINNETIVATWSELGRVNLWNITEQLKSLDNLSAQTKIEKSADVKPLFSFKGHLSEGYGVDWCPTESGTLATSDCSGNIHLWKPNEGTWHVDQRSYKSHTASVEDLQWSPNEKNVMASCSVDKSIKIWDMRENPSSACKLTAVDAHASDVNVISWNKKESRFILSGGDDGVINVWDLRQFGAAASAVATFKQHTAPITTIEWHPNEPTVFASGGADDQIAQWDLSVEVDDEADAGSGNQNDDYETDDLSELAKLPPQLLFIHQGQSDIKELHWHPQCPGTLISTAHSGFNVFRTISV